jgi:hypothetical protein
MKALLSMLVGGPSGFAITLAMEVLKIIWQRVADPEKIADFLVKWLKEISEKDDKIDWKDKLSELVKK